MVFLGVLFLESQKHYAESFSDSKVSASHAWEAENIESEPDSEVSASHAWEAEIQDLDCVPEPGIFPVHFPRVGSENPGASGCWEFFSGGHLLHMCGK